MNQENSEKSRRSDMAAVGALCVLALMGMATFSKIQPDIAEASAPPSRRALSTGIMTPGDAMENSEEVKAWRESVKKACNEAPHPDDMVTVKQMILDGFHQSHIRTGTHEYNLPMEQCPYVFLDFGANVGDSAGHMIDAGLVRCDHYEHYKVPRPHFDIKEGKVMEDPNPHPLLDQWLRERIYEFNPNLGPEDYCVYGIEGNPVFTERLRNLERDVMRTHPRPVRRLHFLTETVGAAADGPTTLFLDTVNAGQNFWGSSIISEHIDVKRSATKEGGLVEAPVSGITLSSLMRQSLSYFSGNRIANGEHVMIKIDIEGGEFPLLNEAYESGVLCDFVKGGNRVDIIVEYHTSQYIGENADMKMYQEVVQKGLVECGVRMHEMGMTWGR